MKISSDVILINSLTVLGERASHCNSGKKSFSEIALRWPFQLIILSGLYCFYCDGS